MSEEMAGRAWEEERRVGAGSVRGGSEAAEKCPSAAVLLPAPAAGSGDFPRVGEQSPQHGGGDVSVVSAGAFGQHVLQAAPAGPASRARPSRTPMSGLRLRMMYLSPDQVSQKRGPERHGNNASIHGIPRDPPSAHP